MWKSNSLPPVIILFLKKFLRSARVCVSVAHGGNSHRNPKPSWHLGSGKNATLRVLSLLSKTTCKSVCKPLLGEQPALPGAIQGMERGGAALGMPRERARPPESPLGSHPSEAQLIAGAERRRLTLYLLYLT